jgi:hypothetical protein
VIMIGFGIDVISEVSWVGIVGSGCLGLVCHGCFSDDDKIRLGACLYSKVRERHKL